MESGLSLIQEEINNYQIEIDSLEILASNDHKRIQGLEQDIQIMSNAMSIKKRQLTSLNHNLQTKTNKITTVKALLSAKKSLIDTIKLLPSLNSISPSDSLVNEIPITQLSSQTTFSQASELNNNDINLQNLNTDKFKPTNSTKCSTPNLANEEIINGK